MKSAGRVFCLWVACFWLCLAAPFAAAERGPRWADGRGLPERGQQDDRRSGRHESAPEDVRQDVHQDGRRERLSPEDRLQLRRDVRDAGRDIYPERPRRHDSRRR